MSSLGAQLQQTLNTLAANNLAQERAKDADALAQIAKDQKLREDLVQNLMASITDSVQKGLVPTHKITDYTLKEWIRNCLKSPKTAYYPIWNDLLQWAQTQQLTLSVHDEHDGGGMDEWITIRVHPAL